MTYPPRPGTPSDPTRIVILTVFNRIELCTHPHESHDPEIPR